MFKIDSLDDEISYFIYDENNDELIPNPLDEDVARYLGIDYNEYIEIMLKYGACKKYGGEYFFRSYEDCEKFLNSKELEPYLIMARIIE